MNKYLLATGLIACLNLSTALVFAQTASDNGQNPSGAIASQASAPAGAGANSTATAPMLQERLANLFKMASDIEDAYYDRTFETEPLLERVNRLDMQAFGHKEMGSLEARLLAIKAKAPKDNQKPADEATLLADLNGTAQDNTNTSRNNQGRDYQTHMDNMAPALSGSMLVYAQPAGIVVDTSEKKEKVKREKPLIDLAKTLTNSGWMSPDGEFILQINADGKGKCQYAKFPQQDNVPWWIEKNRLHFSAFNNLTHIAWTWSMALYIERGSLIGAAYDETGAGNSDLQLIQLF
jgi:hypothetical protein